MSTKKIEASEAIDSKGSYVHIKYDNDDCCTVSFSSVEVEGNGILQGTRTEIRLSKSALVAFRYAAESILSQYNLWNNGE